MTMLKYTLINIGRKYLSRIYARHKKQPIQNKIIFFSRQADQPSLDFQMLEAEIRRQHPEYETIMFCRFINSDLKSRIRYCIFLVKQIKELATARVAILDSYSIPISLLDHRPELLVLQIWHSVGTMKKFGYSILDQPEGSSSALAHTMRMHHGYSYVLAAGEGYKDHLAEGFHFDRDRILTYPLPRLECLQNPIFIKENRQQIFQSYPALREKKNIVYVPTFRKGEDDAFCNALSALADQLDFSQYNLILKNHPLVHLQYEDPRIICDQTFSSLEMLCVADLVISDYSCIIYEAAVLKKPIYFYVYDYDHYMSARDIYIDYMKEMPGPICKTATELVTAISSGKYDHDKLERFLHKYVEATGHETENIVNFIFGQIQTDY